jgi:hypothetical protein
MWSPTESPLFRIPPEPGSDEPLWARRSEVAGGFALRVVLGQPGTYAALVLGDLADSFAPTRGQKPGQSPAERWRFRLELLPSERRERIIRENGGGEATVQPSLAAFLHGYQRFGYVPGPVLALCLALGLAGAVAGGRAGGRGLRHPLSF